MRRRPARRCIGSRPANGLLCAWISHPPGVFVSRKPTTGGSRPVTKFIGIPFAGTLGMALTLDTPDLTGKVSQGVGCRLPEGRREGEVNVGQKPRGGSPRLVPGGSLNARASHVFEPLAAFFNAVGPRWTTKGMSRIAQACRRRLRRRIASESSSFGDGVASYRLRCEPNCVREQLVRRRSRLPRSAVRVPSSRR